MLQIDAVVSAKLRETRGRGRSQPLVFNRQIAMYLASRVGRWSTTVIGHFYNHRDHSTVCYSIQKIEKLRLEDPLIAGLLTELEQNIDEQHSRAQAESNSLAWIGPMISESKIELAARSAAEQFYRDFKAALRHSIAHLQPGGSLCIPDPAPLRSADVHVPTQNGLPETVPSKDECAGAHWTKFRCVLRFRSPSRRDTRWRTQASVCEGRKGRLRGLLRLVVFRAAIKRLDGMNNYFRDGDPHHNHGVSRISC